MTKEGSALLKHKTPKVEYSPPQSHSPTCLKMSRERVASIEFRMYQRELFDKRRIDFETKNQKRLAKLEKHRKSNAKDLQEKFHGKQEHIDRVRETKKTKLKNDAFLVKDKYENPKKYYRALKEKPKKVKDDESSSSRSDFSPKP